MRGKRRYTLPLGLHSHMLSSTDRNMGPTDIDRGRPTLFDQTLTAPRSAHVPCPAAHKPAHKPAHTPIRRVDPKGRVLFDWRMCGQIICSE